MLCGYMSSIHIRQLKFTLTYSILLYTTHILTTEMMNDCSKYCVQDTRFCRAVFLFEIDCNFSTFSTVFLFIHQCIDIKSDNRVSQGFPSLQLSE